MAIQTIHDDEAPEQRIYPDLPNYAPDDATFRRLVREGIASFEAGPTASLEQIEAELHEIIHGKG